MSPHALSGLFLDSIPVPIVVTNLHGKVVAASDQFLNLVQLERAELQGKKISVLHLDKFIKGLKKSGRPQSFRADAYGQRWSIRLNPHYDGTKLKFVIQTWSKLGTPLELQREESARAHEINQLTLRALQAEDDRLMMSQEIGELKRQCLTGEDLLRQREKNMIAIGDSLSLGIWACDPDGKLTYASKSFLAFLGVTLANISMPKIFERTVNSSPAGLLKRWADCLKTGADWHEELKVRGGGGEIRVIYSMARCFRDTEGNIVNWSGVNLDLTDRFNAEIQLNDSRVLFRQLTDKLTDQGVWLTSLQDSAIRHLSPGVAHIWGVPEDELRRNPEILLSAVHPEDKGTVQTSNTNVASGDSTTARYRILRPDGSLRWIKVKSFPVRNSIGRIYQVARIATDITEYQKAQIKLKRATFQAVVASRVKTQFLANMSHEIRTPLNAILGFTDLISQTKLPDDTKTWVETIQRNGKHLLGLVDEILDISQIESRGITIDFHPTDALFEAREAIQLLEPRAHEKKLNLRLSIEGKIPPRISCNAKRLRQILINLIGNAIKFTDSGSVTLKIRDQQDQGRTMLEFIVADTGRGIPPDLQKNLFQAFMQGDPSTKRLFGGTGLGLAISKSLAAALGGTVELTRSAEGKGSVFTLRLPAESPDYVAAAAAAAENIRASRAPSKLALKDIRVLVVDDSPDNRDLISLLLEKSGAAVECAKSGYDGIAMAEKRRYDVILMDIQMPGMDGVATVKRLRDSNYRRPILALTAHAMSDERQRLLRSGFDDHLSKPINAQGLIDAVYKFSQSAAH